MVEKLQPPKPHANSTDNVCVHASLEPRCTLVYTCRGSVRSCIIVMMAMLIQARLLPHLVECSGMRLSSQLQNSSQVQVLSQLHISSCSRRKEEEWKPQPAFTCEGSPSPRQRPASLASASEALQNRMQMAERQEGTKSRDLLCRKKRCPLQQDLQSSLSVRSL